MHHASLIKALGGFEAVAKALGCDRSRAHRWQQRGQIPVHRWAAVIELAGKQGIHLSADDLLRHGRENGVADAATGNHENANSSGGIPQSREARPRSPLTDAVLDRWAAGERTMEIVRSLNVPVGTVPTILNAARQRGDERAVWRKPRDNDDDF